VVESGFGGMRVSVDEAGENRIAAEIDLLRASGGEREDFFVCADA